MRQPGSGHRRIRAAWMAALMALLLAGCWKDACVSPWGICEEWDASWWADPGDLCWGEYEAMTTCADLGYTLECGGTWIVPGSVQGGTCP